MAPRRLVALWLCLTGPALAAARGNASNAGQAPQHHLREARALQAAASVEVFYKVNCPHCAEFVDRAVFPLAEARLPGVQLTLLPMIEPPGGAQQCLASSLCRAALAPLCALRTTFPQPTPANAPALVPAVKFVACHLIHTGGGAGISADTVAECAAEAPLSGRELEDCAAGPEVFNTMYSDAYIDTILGAVHRLKRGGFPEHMGMPLVFLNGDLLQCAGSGCSGVKHPNGVTPLPQPGTLLQLVCSKLYPKPDICLSIEGSSAPPVPVVAQTQKCENCADLGSFHWPQPARVWRPVPLLATALATLLGAGLLVLAGWRHRHQQAIVGTLLDPGGQHARLQSSRQGTVE